MKRWHIVLLAMILIAGILGMIGIFTYKFYVVPKYIEPIVEEIGEYVNKEDVMDALYSEAEHLHADGVIEDDIYAKFMRAYQDYKRDDYEYAKYVLDAYNSENTTDSKDNTLSTKYASYKVGVETILINDDDSNGKADVKYSDERTSDRIKVEDVIEAEKVIEKTEKQEENISESTPSPTPNIVESAYEKLRANMTSDEFSSFTSIMKKLDIGVLKTYLSDKEGLKSYLHEKLTDDEYSTIVNLGYKYVSVLIKNEK